MKLLPNSEWKRAFFAGRRTLPCFYCRLQLTESLATVDHVIPRSRGGSHKRNRVIACEPCNKEKGNKSLTEFVEEKLAQVGT